MRSLLLSGVALVSLVSCSEQPSVFVSDLSAELVSCNGQTTPEALALYLDFDVHNDSDEPLEVTRVTLATDDPEVVVVAGSQSPAPAIVVAASESAAFACKDGFTVTGFPGENVTTAVRVQVEFKVGEATGTASGSAMMRSSIAWDNCQNFLGNPVACHAQ